MSGLLLTCSFVMETGSALSRQLGGVNGNGRDQHLSTRKPRTGIDDQVADNPGVVIKIEILDVPYIAVNGLDRVILEFFGRALLAPIES